jgi:hypothetical protein
MEPVTSLGEDSAKGEGREEKEREEQKVKSGSLG